MKSLSTEIDLLTGIEHYLAGSSPSMEPSTSRGFLRVQEKLIPPGCSVAVLRQLRADSGFFASVMGHALGLDTLAVSLEPLNRIGSTSTLPRGLGIYGSSGVLIPFTETLVGARNIDQEMYQLLLSVSSTPLPLKRLIRQIMP